MDMVVGVKGGRRNRRCVRNKGLLFLISLMLSTLAKPSRGPSQSGSAFIRSLPAVKPAPKMAALPILPPSFRDHSPCYVFLALDDCLYAWSAVNVPLDGSDVLGDVDLVLPELSQTRRCRCPGCVTDRLGLLV